MTSPEVMWTFLRTPCVTTLVGNNCVVGPGGERSKVRESGVGEGSECENLKDQNPKTRNPEAPKYRNLKFRLDSLVAPRSLAFDHDPWMHGLGTKKTGAIAQKLQSQTELKKFVESKRFLIRVGL
jgi:hypothetical protein